MNSSLSATTKIFTVRELVFDSKARLNPCYPDVWVQGEISNLTLHSSGHAISR